MVGRYVNVQAHMPKLDTMDLKISRILSQGTCSKDF